MNNTVEHQKLVDDILFHVGSNPKIRVWIRVVGLFRMLFSNAKVKVGMPGETDIDGIIAPMGRKLCIEVKTGTGKLSKDQIKYRDMILRFGGVHIEARSLKQCLEELEKYL